MASQITSLAIVNSTDYSDADQRKHQKLRVTVLCVGNSTGTGEFPAKMASNAEKFPFDDVIMGVDAHVSSWVHSIYAWNLLIVISWHG